MVVFGGTDVEVPAEVSVRVVGAQEHVRIADDGGVRHGEGVARHVDVAVRVGGDAHGDVLVAGSELPGPAVIAIRVVRAEEGVVVDVAELVPAGAAHDVDVAARVGGDAVGAVAAQRSELARPEDLPIRVVSTHEGVPGLGFDSFEGARGGADDVDAAGGIGGYAGDVRDGVGTELARPAVLAAQVVRPDEGFTVAGSGAFDRALRPADDVDRAGVDGHARSHGRVGRPELARPCDGARRRDDRDDDGVVAGGIRDAGGRDLGGTDVVGRDLAAGVDGGDAGLAAAPAHGVVGVARRRHGGGEHEARVDAQFGVALVDGDAGDGARLADGERDRGGPGGIGRAGRGDVGGAAGVGGDRPVGIDRRDVRGRCCST
jgi:hypothetical protein